MSSVNHLLDAGFLARSDGKSKVPLGGPRLGQIQDPRILDIRQSDIEKLLDPHLPPVLGKIVAGFEREEPYPPLADSMHPKDDIQVGGHRSDLRFKLEQLYDMRRPLDGLLQVSKGGAEPVRLAIQSWRYNPDTDDLCLTVLGRDLVTAQIPAPPGPSWDESVPDTVTYRYSLRKNEVPIIKFRDLLI